MADELTNDPLVPSDDSDGIFNPDAFLDAAKKAADEAGQVTFSVLPTGDNDAGTEEVETKEQFTRNPIDLETFKEVLPTAIYLLSLSGDRRKHVELDAALDAMGYPPVDTDSRPGYITVPPARQEIYDALNAR